MNWFDFSSQRSRSLWPPSHVSDRNISVTLSGIFFQICHKIHLYSKMNLVRFFGGQRLKVTVTYSTFFFLAITQEFIRWHNFTPVCNRIKWWSDDIFRFSQRSASLWHHDALQEPFSGQLFNTITLEQKTVTIFHLCELVAVILGVHLETALIVKIFCAVREHVCERN